MRITKLVPLALLFFLPMLAHSQGKGPDVPPGQAPTFFIEGVEFAANHKGGTTVTLDGPDGVLETLQFVRHTSPFVDVSGLDDGLYQYEITRSLDAPAQGAARSAGNGRSGDSSPFSGKSPGKNGTESGYFRVLNGETVDPELAEE